MLLTTWVPVRGLVLATWVPVRGLVLLPVWTWCPCGAWCWQLGCPCGAWCWCCWQVGGLCGVGARAEPGAAVNLGACAGPGAGNLDLVPVRTPKCLCALGEPGAAGNLAGHGAGNGARAGPGAAGNLGGCAD